MATEFTITGVTVSGAFPETFTFAGLSAPVSGTLPTFSTAPVVFIRNSSTKRYLFVDRTSIDTTGFDIDAGDMFDEDPPYTVDIGIITTDVTAAGAGVATAVAFPYYCSFGDVEDILAQLKRSTGGTNASTKNLNQNRLIRYISMAFGRINASLNRARYAVPATNSIKQVITNSLTASTSTDEEVVTLNQVEDGDKFTAGDTVRIHGTSGNSYADEFTEVVAVNNDLVDVLYLKNSYDALSTVEIVTNGMQMLRHLNAQGAALLALGGLTVGFGTGENSKEAALVDEFNRELKMIERNEIMIPNISRRTPATSYIRDNSDSLPNDGDPVFWSNSSAGVKF